MGHHQLIYLRLVHWTVVTSSSPVSPTRRHPSWSTCIKNSSAHAIAQQLQSSYLHETWILMHSSPSSRYILRQSPSKKQVFPMRRPAEVQQLDAISAISCSCLNVLDNAYGELAIAPTPRLVCLQRPFPQLHWLGAILVSSCPLQRCIQTRDH